ncbi:hypothetical protein DFQ26_002457 [Actinomortierella ambigua]|nr:hypothetical protein DFQ26_002457 [Actinomortierella ambigua]
MPPGVFVTSADGIELLASKAPFPSSTQPLRITALAHPSPLNIATTHGVFELAAESLSAQEQGDMILEPQERSASLHRCLRFHHKPSMAIVLANLFPDLPRRCDLEAWADILDFQNTLHHASPASPTPQPLHPPIDLDNDHARGRAMVHQALQQAGVQLELVVLNASQFYHLGTMTEFLDAVCLDVDFMATMGIENNVPGLGLVVADDGGTHRPVAGNDIEEKEEDPQIIRSKDCTTTTITLQPPIFVQNSLLVSNNNALLACLPPWTMIIDTDLLASPQEKDNGGAGHCNSNSPGDAWLPLATQQTFQGLPAGVCLFTLQLAADAFVTFSFSTKDDMKKPARTTTSNSTSSNNNSSGNHPETAPLQQQQQQQQQQPWWETLCIFESIPVAKMLSPLFFAGSTESSNPVDGNRSLWDAPIFEKAATKHESTLLALQRLARLTATTTTTATTPTSSSSSSSSPSSPLARLLQKDVHVSGWISLKDAAEKARPYEIQG